MGSKLKQLIKADRSRAKEVFTEAILTPTWRHAIFISGGLLNVEQSSEQDIREEQLFVFESLADIGIPSSGFSNIRELIQLSLFASVVQEKFTGIKKRLQALIGRHRMNGTVLVEILKSVAHMNKRLSPSSDATDIYKKSSSSIDVTFGNARVSPVEAIEAHVDVVEFLLRYYFKSENEYPLLSGKTEPSQAWTENDIHELVVFASIWLQTRRAWNLARFLGWNISSSDAEQGPKGGKYWIVSPCDRAEEVRFSSSQFRKSVFTMLLANLDNVASHSRLRDSAESAIQVLVEKMQWAPYPKTSRLVTSEFDPQLLLHASRTFDSTLENLQIEDFFLADLESDIDLNVLEKDKKSIDWCQFRDGNRVLRALASGLIYSQHSRKTDENVCVIVRKSELARAVSRAIGTDFQEGESIVRLMTFDPKDRRFEIYDRPLVEFDSNRIALIPHLVTLSSPTRRLEHFAQAARTGGTQSRGKRFEERVAQILVDNGARLLRNVKFVASDGKQVEFDVIAVLQGQIALFECKCMAEQFTELGIYNSVCELEHAASQLKRQREILRSDWARLKEYDRSGVLPSELCDVFLFISVNTFEFSGREFGDAVVIDHRALDKFFDPTSMSKIEIVNSENVARISISGVGRKDESTFDSSPKSLSLYARSLPQLKVYSKRCKFGTTIIPEVSNERTAIIVEHSHIEMTQEELEKE